MNCWIQRWTARRGWLLLCAMAFIVASGCGGAKKYGADVTGTVTVDGELARTGTITFHPVDKEGKIAVGRIYPDGSFSLRTGQGDLSESDGGTVVPGEYIVTIVVSGPSLAPTTPGGPPPAGPLLIAERYIDPATSDLRQKIVDGDNVLAFDLERAQSEAESSQADEAAADGTEEETDTENAETDQAEPSDADAAAPAESPAAPINETESAPVEGAKP